MRHRALWAYVVVASLMGFVLVGVFHAIEVRRIDAWATDALDLAREESRGKDGTVHSPGDWYHVTDVVDIDGTPMAVTVDDSGSTGTAPWEVATYYGTHRDDWENLGTRLLRSDDRTFYAQRAKVGTGGPDLLYAVDVTAPFAVLDRSTGALAALVAVVAVLLGAAGLWVVARLDDADKRSRAFFANASHELKTPLAAIRGYAAALGDGTVNADEAVAVLERESDRMGGLVDSILALSKMDAGIRAPAFAPVDLRETAYAALQDLEGEAYARSVALVPRMKEPVLVAGDDGMLFSVVSNMVSNAVAHAVSTVTVEASNTAGQVELTVVDDGAADEKALDRAFERFHSDTQGGWGIGLALAREYARAHGGDLALYREDGTTVCRLTLPTDADDPASRGRRTVMDRISRALTGAVAACALALSLGACASLPQEAVVERPVTDATAGTFTVEGTVVARSPQALVVARNGLVTDPVLSDSPTVFENQISPLDGEPDFVVLTITGDTPSAAADGTDQSIYAVEPGQRVSVDYTVNVETEEHAYGEGPVQRRQRIVNTATSVTVK